MLQIKCHHIVCCILHVVRRLTVLVDIESFLLDASHDPYTAHCVGDTEYDERHHRAEDD